MGSLLKSSATSADANSIATMANVRNPTVRIGINGYPLRRIVRKIRRLLKYWNGSRVEAEGADGKERVRRIPFLGL